MDMAAERSRDGLTGGRDEENRLGWPPIASALENESMRRWRLLDGPVCARSPLDFGAKSWDSAADHPPFRRANHRHPVALESPARGNRNWEYRTFRGANRERCVSYF